jgi:TRAP-type C4-dicarboxylate transport system permease large subunit
MIVFLIWGVTVFVRFLGFSSVAEAFSQCVTTIDAPLVVILIGILLAYAVLGMFMDVIGMLLLSTRPKPVSVLPLQTGKLRSQF